MLKSFKNYFHFFNQYLGWRIFIVLLFTFTAAIAESVGILLFVPVIAQFDISASVVSSNNKITDLFVKLFEILNIDFTLQNALILIAVSFILKGALVFGSYVFSALLRGHLLYTLKSNLLFGIQQLEYSKFLTRDVGSLSALVNEQVTKALLSFNFFLHFSTHVLTSVLYVAAGMLASPILGVFGACMAILVLLLFKRLNTNLKKISLQNSNLTNQITQTAIEGINNFKYLKSTDLFTNFNLKIKALMTTLKKLNIYNGVAEGFVISVREPILAVTLCIILYIQVGVLESAIANSLVAMLLFYRAMNSVFNSQRTWQNLLEHSGSIDLIDSELNDFSEQSEQINGVSELSSTWSNISFNRVSYKPLNKNEPVLKNLSFTIKRNSMTVIMGTSGSGKTTLVDLLIGLLRPTNGTIKMDDIDIDLINLASFRKTIGYVSQDNVAFSDTIANNVSSWNIDNDNKDNQLKKLQSACEKANILDVINGLEQGFQTEVGDRGAAFSGGQRQRMFLAREFYRQPGILILDEPTSALDSGTEKLVFEAITALKGKTTIICITHRTNLASTADTVINL